jgi:hypothetical protein
VGAFLKFTVQLKEVSTKAAMPVPNPVISYVLNESAANAKRSWPKRQKRIGARHVVAGWLNGRVCLSPIPASRRPKWIIAALCCRAATRWAESLRRNKPALFH